MHYFDKIKNISENYLMINCPCPNYFMRKTHNLAVVYRNHLSCQSNIKERYKRKDCYSRFVPKDNIHWRSIQVNVKWIFNLTFYRQKLCIQLVDPYFRVPNGWQTNI